MEKRKLEESINELFSMVVGEMVPNLIEADQETLNALRALKLAKNVIMEQNNDIEELKGNFEKLDWKLDLILHEVKQGKGEA